MSEKTLMLVRRIVTWVTAALTLVAGTCFISACINVYGGEKGNYSRGAVAEAFNKISIPVYLWLLFVVLGIVLSYAFPQQKKVANVKLFSDSVINRLRSRLDMSLAESSLAQKAEKEQKLRKQYKLITLGLLFVGVVVFAIYGANYGNFAYEDTGYSNTVFKATMVALACVLPATASYFILLPYATNSRERERAVLTKLLSDGTAKVDPNGAVERKNNKVVNILRISFLALGVLFLLLGIFGGGVEAVFAKAVKLCTECVGLG